MANKKSKASDCQNKSRASEQSTIERVVEHEIMPAGAPWSKKTPEGDVSDPPVPNRARTEMKNAKGGK